MINSNKKYIALKNNPDFIKKYKKKFIYDHNDKNTIPLDISNNLFNQSLSYLSEIQQYIHNTGIDNYLSGGGSLKLYTKFLLNKRESSLTISKNIFLRQKI